MSEDAPKPMTNAARHVPLRLPWAQRMTSFPDPITGAELQTLREACCLTREELGALAGVAARTVKHWESGRAGVPADVAALVQRLDATIQQAADQGARAVAQASARQGGTAPADVVLIRYRSADHLARYRPDMAGQPAGVQGAIVQRVAQAMRQRGQLVRVAWMMPDAFEAWRTQHQQPDTDATRAAWAADQIPHQARAHRADQPPEGAA